MQESEIRELPGEGTSEVLASEDDASDVAVIGLACAARNIGRHIPVGVGGIHPSGGPTAWVYSEVPMLTQLLPNLL